MVAHELTAAEQEAAATALFAMASEARAQREREMPTEADALRHMRAAFVRLKEMGWREASYAPAPVHDAQVIEVGSTGIHDAYRDEERRWWIVDTNDTWPSRPCLWRPKP